MRERARDKGRLEDIVEYSNNVTELIEGQSLDTLVSDKRIYYSVMKNVEIVGEAAFMLSKDFVKAHPQTPWKIVQGMRHVLVHDYAQVVAETLYDTAVNSIPILRQQVEQYLQKNDWDKWVKEEVKPDPKDELEHFIPTIIRMKGKGFSAEEISELTGFSIELIDMV